MISVMGMLDICYNMLEDCLCWQMSLASFVYGEKRNVDLCRTESVFVTVRGSKLVAVGVRHARMASFFRTFSSVIVSKTDKEQIYWVLKIDFTLLLPKIDFFFFPFSVLFLFHVI